MRIKNEQVNPSFEDGDKDDCVVRVFTANWIVKVFSEALECHHVVHSSLAWPILLQSSESFR